MSEHTRRRDFDATYARLQAARDVGDAALSAQLSRQLRELAPAGQDPTARRVESRTRRLRRRRIIGTAVLMGVLAALFAFAGLVLAVVLPFFEPVGCTIGGAAVGALLGAAIASTNGQPDGPSPLDTFSSWASPGEG